MHTYTRTYIHTYIHTYIRCSNNQAEQLAVFKALEIIETIDITEHSPRTVTIFTDSRIAIDSLRTLTTTATSSKNQGRRCLLIERANRTIEFSWVKAHVGIHGNELADRLAKAAAPNRDTTIAFNRIPLSTLYSEIEKEAKGKWQKEWEGCTKAAITKQLFFQT